MIIRDMFAENINRPINGVIKVDQSGTDVIEQEVREYVITKELKKHFISFFNFYGDSFSAPTADVGVWISGFFGSGKSHFLKMLSYLLENRDVAGTSTVEMFRKKFDDDPATFMLIDKATKANSETILFNIDIEGPMNKDKTAVLRVFAKMFYNHLGFFGDNLKVAMLEQYIDQMGKTEEFRRVFEQKKGKAWLDQRKAFAFNGKYIVPTLVEVLDISEEDAKRWFSDKTPVEFSIARLVEDIKAYVDSKPKDFRLLFMIDEVGQYVGTDTDMLLNLQSLTEKLGSECNGKVWVMCTGQEAIDEIIKVRADEFSRIQARFKTRLSLSSSSVDEVIQKRVLKKTSEAKKQLEKLYDENDSALRNLFSFSDSILDIKGFSGPNEFAVNYPFVPYQFIIMQKVFAEIRKHGNSGKHLSGGERSMLSGFQEATQALQTKDEFALVPFYRFYDTVHTFLDSSIRRVIERCQKAADNHYGILNEDVDLLKLLYLIRYVDDIPSTVDNIVILMADDIRCDKIILREKIRESLNRLFSQNYIGTVGDTYKFLTDEEQDIQREISNTNVDTSEIVGRISSMIFADIYTAKKFRYGKYDFDFDKMVDGVTSGAVTGGMKLRFLTIASDAVDKSELHLTVESKGQAIAVLDDSPYYESLERAMKIRKYVKQRNVAQLPKSVQDIIRNHQDEAGKYESDAAEQLKKAIINARFYVDGEHIPIKGNDAKVKIDQALEYLVIHVYHQLDLIGKHAESDADILSILNGDQMMITGGEPNRDAAAKVEEFLVIQNRNKLPTSMADVQSRYQSVPYGWKEIDIAAVVAMLISQQKVTIKYGGATIQPNNPKLPEMLRKKSEIGKTIISQRVSVTAAKMKAVRELLREYFDVMSVPNDEDGLVSFIVERFNAHLDHYKSLDERYNTDRKYPERSKVQDAIKLVEDILSQQKDNTALVERVLKREDDLFDSKEGLEKVETFFKNQVQVFDAAIELEQSLMNDLEYIKQDAEANNALNQIRLITQVQPGGVKAVYSSIPTLNTLMQTVKKAHNEMLRTKREELLDMVTQCSADVRKAADGEHMKAKPVFDAADRYYNEQRQKINSCESLALMEGYPIGFWNQRDSFIKRVKAAVAPPVEVNPKPPVKNEVQKPVVKVQKRYRAIYRQSLLTATKLESEAEIDAYIDRLRDSMKKMLNGYDGIELK